MPVWFKEEFPFLILQWLQAVTRFFQESSPPFCLGIIWSIVNFDDLFQKITNETNIYLSEWWKKENQVDNNLLSSIECNILVNNFNNLIQIKSIINSFNQVKNIKTKRIKMNSNIIEISYYGKFSVLLKNLLYFDILYKEKKGCVISKI